MELFVSHFLRWDLIEKRLAMFQVTLNSTFCCLQQFLQQIFCNRVGKNYRWVLCCVIFSGCSGIQNYAPVRSFQLGKENSDNIYIVKPGDTLYSIGFSFGYDYRQLSAWNKIAAPYHLQIGQKVKLYRPSPVYKRKTRSKNRLKAQTKRRTSSHKKTSSAQKKRSSSQKTSVFSNNNKKLLKLIWQWPIKNRILKDFLQSNSKGIDIFGRMGQQVRAAASGKVVYTGSGLKGYGNLLIIKHNDLYLSAYAHNRRLIVKEGQFVKKGQVIAEVGRVGGKRTSLHFEIRKNGKPVNPMKYLPKL